MSHILVYGQDEDEILELACLIKGHKVDCETDFQSALDQVVSPGSNITVVIADIHSEGAFLSQQIRLRSIDSQAPLIILTGQPDYEGIVESCGGMESAENKQAIEQALEDYGEDIYSAVCECGASLGLLVYGDPELDKASLNNMLCEGIFSHWLFGRGPSEYPYSPGSCQWNQYTYEYLNSSLGILVPLLGGWSGLRACINWCVLEQDLEYLEQVLSTLKYWGELLRKDQQLFVSNVLIARSQVNHDSCNIVAPALRLIANLIQTDELTHTDFVPSTPGTLTIQ